MTNPNHLAAAGRALYGQLWQSALARDLGVNDRTMRRWVAGHEPPETICENGPNDAEMAEIVKIVTKNGMYETTDFFWGAAGENWSA